ncbi:MAG: M18 family aminopeptidase [Spirochaetia bacterium]
MNNTNFEETARDLISFLDICPTSYHTGTEIKKRLISAGFTELRESDPWDTDPDGAYFVERNGSGVIAFRRGTQTASERGFRIICAHTDSPSLKLKTEAGSVKSGYFVVPVEIYGGPIISTWLDRPLIIAGMVYYRNGNGMESRLIRTESPAALIPNPAIHMNRELNKGFQYNAQNHLQTVIALEGVDVLNKLIAGAAGTDPDSVLSADLYLAESAGGSIVGSDSNLISSGRIDNIGGCHAALTAVIESESAETTSVCALFDNEEIGSHTPPGANSNFLVSVLERITGGSRGLREDAYRAYANSFLVSNDAAHAVHPNFSDKHDPAYVPALNGGPVIKANARRSYATTAETEAFFAEACRRAGVPKQKIIGKSDAPSGGTIGPVCSSLTGIPAVDVGIPILGMHSIRETAGVKDQRYMIEAMKAVYNG